jgi:hypothetical protein
VAAGVDTSALTDTAGVGSTEAEALSDGATVAADAAGEGDSDDGATEGATVADAEADGDGDAGVVGVVPGAASGLTSAVIVWVFGSFNPVNTVPTRHAATCGVLTAHAGYDTNRNRDP